MHRLLRLTQLESEDQNQVVKHLKIRQSLRDRGKGSGENGETNGELARENDTRIGIRDYADHNLSVQEKYTSERNKKVMEKRRVEGTHNVSTYKVKERADAIASFLYEMRLQRMMGFVFINTNFLSKLMNTTTMIPCRHFSYREETIEL